VASIEGSTAVNTLWRNPNVTLRTESERRTLSLSTVIEVFPHQVYGGEKIDVLYPVFSKALVP
jgi:hypothetical protein